MLNTPYDHPETQPELRCAAAGEHHIRALESLEAEARAELARIQARRTKAEAVVLRFRIEDTRGIGGVR